MIGDAEAVLAEDGPDAVPVQLISGLEDIFIVSIQAHHATVLLIVMNPELRPHRQAIPGQLTVLDRHLRIPLQNKRL